ncbi:MAG: FAD binding domain-containing protein [Nitriliruptorales bacterium]
MKPPPFRYHAPRTVDAALEVLAGAGDGGKVLAGGQSLIPLLNMRLAAPTDLVDVNRVDGLDRIEVGDSEVRVGAAVRASDLERHGGATAAIPLLREALQLVAHPVIRNRGTICGSLAHADPAAEMPAVLRLLEGSLHIRSADGERIADAARFFVAPLTADLRPGELVTEAVFRVPPPHTGTAFVEVSRRHGDYALCGVAVRATVEDGGVGDARAVLIGVGGVPVTVDLTAAEGDVEAADELARDAVDPDTDIHATAEYRRHLAGVLTARALRTALARAGEAA